MSDTERDDGLDRTIFSTIPEAIEDIRRGRMVLVVDDADRENEGDFIMAAETCTPEVDQLHGHAWRAASSACRARRGASTSSASR